MTTIYCIFVKAIVVRKPVPLYFKLRAIGIFITGVLLQMKVECIF